MSEENQTNQINPDTERAIANMRSYLSEKDIIIAAQADELARLRDQVAELSIRAADAEEAAGEQAATIARLRSENETLLAWMRRAYAAMVRYDESLMVSVVADAPPQVQAVSE